MEWVDFDDVKRAVSLQMVIDRYGLRQVPAADARIGKEQREFYGDD